MGKGKVFPASSARSLVNPMRRLVQSPRRTVKACTIRQSDVVLELGCGPGYFTPSIAEAAWRGHVVALDLQPEMLEFALPRVHGPNVSLVAASADQLPIRSSTIDIAFVATVLGELPVPARLVEEVERVLVPHGRLCVVETRRDSDFIPLGRLESMVEEVGLAMVYRQGPPWQYVACFERPGTVDP
jgi:ubiquinone/menaquinone biosynthesis C-methylase UbiE